MIPEDLCASAPPLGMWIEYAPFLAPLVALILGVIGVEIWRKRRKRRTSIKWIDPPPQAPTEREVKAHDEAVVDLESKATEAGPHVEASPVTDDEIDEWARGE